MIVGLGLDERGSIPGNAGIVLFTAKSSPAQGCNRWILGGLSLGVKQAGHKNDFSAPSYDRIKNAYYVLL